MAVPLTYPDSLPKPAAYRLSPAAHALFGENEIGPREPRIRTRDPSATARVSFRFLEDDYRTFVNWWRDDLLRGHKWFWLQFLGVGGLSWRLVRFLDRYTATLNGHTYWEVNATVVLRDRVGIDELPTTEQLIFNFNGSGVTSAIGLLMTGIDPTKTYRLSLPTGQLYTAFSGWSADSYNGGLTWSNGFYLTEGGYTEGPAGPHTQFFYGGAYFATAEAARAAFPSSYTITGHSSYTAWVYDDNPGDNRGGFSLLLTEE